MAISGLSALLNGALRVRLSDRTANRAAFLVLSRPLRKERVRVDEALD